MQISSLPDDLKCAVMVKCDFYVEMLSVRCSIGPVTLRLEARYKNCKILGQNDGTFVTFLRDKTVTYPATLMG